MRRWLAVSLVAAGLVAATPGLSQGPPTGFETQVEDPNAYPVFPGRDEAFGFCSACHAFRLVASQGMTREQWASSLTWMTERHAMPVLDPADRDVILDYLAKAFPPKAPAGWRSPFAPAQ